MSVACVHICLRADPPGTDVHRCGVEPFQYGNVPARPSRGPRSSGEEARRTATATDCDVANDTSSSGRTPPRTFRGVEDVPLAPVCVCVRCRVP